MLPGWKFVYAILSLGVVTEISAQDIHYYHPILGCEMCESKDYSPICVVYPRLKEFSCGCEIDFAISQGKLPDKFVYYEGNCQKSTTSVNFKVHQFERNHDQEAPYRINEKYQSFPPSKWSPRLTANEGKTLTNLLPSFNRLRRDLRKRGRGHREHIHSNSRSFHNEKGSEAAKESSKKAECQLFYDGDRNFGDKNEDKHFVCKTADPKKVEIL